MSARKAFPEQRAVNQHPAPEFAETVSVTRFWRNVTVGGQDECWLWTGDADDEYGVFYFRGAMRRAPELALSFTTGEKRHPDLDTCHSCDNPICCNPHHLRFDTRQSNVDDMIARGRAARQGRLSDEQVYVIRLRRANGARQEDLAVDYGVSASLISMIVRGKRGASVAGPIEPRRSQYRKAS